MDAKTVFDIDHGWIRDRTELPHKLPFDIDVRKPDAPPDKRHWIYWGSSKTIPMAKKQAEDAYAQGYEIRLVDACTGEVVELRERGKDWRKPDLVDNMVDGIITPF